MKLNLRMNLNLIIKKIEDKIDGINYYIYTNNG